VCVCCRCAALNNKRKSLSQSQFLTAICFHLSELRERGCVFAGGESEKGNKSNFVLISPGINIITQGRLLLFLSLAGGVGEMLSGDACPEAAPAPEKQRQARERGKATFHHINSEIFNWRARKQLFDRVIKKGGETSGERADMHKERKWAEKEVGNSVSVESLRKR
jgi:hypothetical protein